MNLEQLGWNSHFQTEANLFGKPDLIPARIAEEHKSFYTVFSQHGTLLAEIAGKIRFQAEHRSDFPAVGDWVLVSARPNENRASIEAILPRQTLILRKTAGRDYSEQVLASNVDIIFIVTSLNQDFNVRRLERYLAIAWESGCTPVVVLNKADLCSDPSVFENDVQNIAPAVPVHSMSGLSGEGIDFLKPYLQNGKTAIFIGSSGVGKSTILNRLTTEPQQRVQSVRESDDRGRHTTTSRQMILLPDGGIVIDTPGMREIGLWDNETGLSKTFLEIEELAKQCRFRNCKHQTEPGCAVRDAVQLGVLEEERLESYRKLGTELEYVRRKTNIRAQQTAKAYAKRVSKAMKAFYRHKG